MDDSEKPMLVVDPSHYDPVSEKAKKELREAFEQGQISNAKPIVAPPAPQQVQVGRSAVIGVDTSQPMRDALNDLKKSLQDNVGLIEKDLKNLEKAYNERETELNRIEQQITELEKCIELLDNEDTA